MCGIVAGVEYGLARMKKAVKQHHRVLKRRRYNSAKPCLGGGAVTANMKLATNTTSLLCAVLGLASCLVEAAKTTTCNTVSASTSASVVQTFQTTTSSTTTVVKTSKVTGTGTSTVTGKPKLVTSTVTSTTTSISTVSSNDYGALVTVLPSPGFTAMADDIIASTLSASYPLQKVVAVVRNRRRHWQRDEVQKRQDPSSSYPATVYCTAVNVLTASSTTTTTVAAKTSTLPGGTSTVTTTATSTTTSTTNTGIIAPAATHYAACAFNNLVETISGQGLRLVVPTVNIYAIENAADHIECCQRCQDSNGCAGWQ
ncbi:hypothetical protein M409DRAFT_52524 [Zasmidium cellare ATCC 36951]|uniref:Uncharacterized protein n=1 Tax=Zasmidium cellare ATCC 36951 TaxID=1080233 RepID=A0A6A6CSX5_ZASCE|nr:uncharacterized protein M409DRAFT_52524 [Zasmidium cellare ATCC 36951]KAF2169260.1 hypothetical protein M409DRAFT_52524 [Zasmidium cellare ATCC 36951]